MSGRKYKNMEERLMHNSVVDPATDCWNWIGSKDGRGYGCLNVRIDGKHTTLKAHRAAYQELVGPIPDGLDIDHKCYNTLCINPNHLEPVSPEENLNRRRPYKKRRNKRGQFE